MADERTTIPGEERVLVTVLVPVFNERKTIVDILEKVGAQRLDGVSFEVIVVDDGSTDGTAEVLADRPDLYGKLITLERNSGKGAAVRTGLHAATGDFVLFQDADLEYDPADYAKLLEPVMRRGADLVLGSRLSASPVTRVHYFWHKVGNRALTLAFDALYNMTFTDIYSCYVLFRRDLLDPDKLRSDGWDQHAEILCKVVASARQVYEVPISYYGRTYAEGKKIRARHALQVFMRIIIERVKLAASGRRRR